MRDFWDARARENAAFYVESRLAYGDPDMAAFWAIGEEVLAGYATTLGVVPGPQDDVLDIGCGLGRITRALAARVRSVIGLDVSGEMLARAGEHNAHLTNVTWIHGDGTSLAGVADASVSGVVSHVVFQHLPDPELTYGYVREMGRVLRPGGWAAFQVSDDPSIHARRSSGGFRALARRALGRGPRGTADPAWLGSAVDLDALGEAARAGGLTVERIRGAGTQYCLVRLAR